MAEHPLQRPPKPPGNNWVWSNGRWVQRRPSNNGNPQATRTDTRGPVGKAPSPNHVWNPTTRRWVLRRPSGGGNQRVGNQPVGDPPSPNHVWKAGRGWVLRQPGTGTGTRDPGESTDDDGTGRLPPRRQASYTANPNTPPPEGAPANAGGQYWELGPGGWRRKAAQTPRPVQQETAPTVQSLVQQDLDEATARRLVGMWHPTGAELDAYNRALSAALAALSPGGDQGGDEGGTDDGRGDPPSPNHVWDETLGRWVLRRPEEPPPEGANRGGTGGTGGTGLPGPERTRRS